jgi:hypothetical protein
MSSRPFCCLGDLGRRCILALVSPSLVNLVARTYALTLPPCLMSVSYLSAAALILVLWSLYKLLPAIFRTSRTTRLHGPPDGNILLGCTRMLHDVDDPGLRFNDWTGRYGHVYEIKSFLNSKRLVLCDPKAIAHFYARDTVVYGNTPYVRFFLDIFVSIVVFIDRLY